METLQTAVNILGNGFFPICVSGFLFWYVWNRDKQHKEEISELRKSIDNNTKVLEKFINKMKGGVE